ncbi:MAG: gfo/Idh/MocA family oxidoreductase [Chloroflexi bacterium]|nr:MAG: gfo/Idh/MocA family oxidoreductase [Chloroflexota bacterium]
MANMRWGILGTGLIAGLFAEGLSAVDDADIAAVGSRTQQNADTFGDRWHVPNRHASYEALANDPDVDVIYIATPHPFHYENALLCLNAGKHVLIEKPFAMNARQAKEIIDLARSKNLFAMEAMWTRFVPAIVKVREWIAAGKIGDVCMVRASLSFRAPFDPTHRLFAPELGGGALLDVGIYPISFAYMLLGAPQKVASTAYLGETGTDDYSSYLFTYDGGKIAQLWSGVHLSVPVEAQIFGTEGFIHIEQPWINPRVIKLVTGVAPGVEFMIPFDGNLYDEQIVHVPTTGNGYNYEAMEVADCIRAGKGESDIMPLDETLAIMQTMDAMRAEWGLAYANE